MWRMVEKKKNHLFDKTFSYICGFHWNWKKYTKKVVLFYYISDFYLFTFFFFGPNFYSNFYIIFLFKWLFFFLKFYIEIIK